MQEHYTKRGVELNEARLRMATLPSPADEVLFTDGTWVPLVAVQGVYVLPGIPKLFQSMVAAHVQRFQGSRFFSQTLFTQLGEGDLAVALTKVSSEHAKVAIGSYPNTSADAKDGWYKVKMSFTARDEAAVSAAVEAARQALGAGNTFHAQPSDQ